MERSGLPSHSQMSRCDSRVSRCDSRESRGGVASVGASPWGLPHPRETMWRPGSQGRLGCPKSGHRCLERHHGCPSGMELMLALHQECPGVVKLVMELHHVSQWGNQEEFQDGEASVWTSSCKFRW